MDGILSDSGPTSSLEEDLNALGLGNFFEQAKPAAKPDEEEEQRVEVPVRQEACGDKMDDEEEEEEEEEVEVDVEEDEDIDEDEDEDGDPKMEAAFEVLDAFYAQLSEGETDDIDHDALVGVIEAYEYITEMPELILEKRRRKKIRGKKAVGVSAVDVFKQRHKGMKMAKGKMLKQDPKTGKVKKVDKPKGWRQREKKTARVTHKAGAMKKRAKSVQKGRRMGLYNDYGSDNTPIEELVADLNALREAVTEPRTVETETETYDLDELREGFESIGTTAWTWMERIAEEVRETLSEDEDPDEDERVQMGRHLEGLSRDAAKYIEMIEDGTIAGMIDEGETDIEVVEDDLRNLAADLEDAANAMKQID
jgi:hypothetical protein